MLKKISSEDIKYASINIGLKEGYKSQAIEYTYEEVLKIYKEWIVHRLEVGGIVLPAFIETGYFVYGFIDKHKNQVSNSEKAVKINIEIIKEYCIDIFYDDKKILDLILDLARNFGIRLKQERVHIEFNKNKYILE